MRELGAHVMHELALEAPTRVRPGREAPLAPGLNGIRNRESPSAYKSEKYNIHNC